MTVFKTDMTFIAGYKSFWPLVNNEQVDRHNVSWMVANSLYIGLHVEVWRAAVLLHAQYTHTRRE